MSLESSRKVRTLCSCIYKAAESARQSFHEYRQALKTKTIDKSEELYRSLERKSIFVQHLEIEFKERNSELCRRETRRIAACCISTSSPNKSYHWEAGVLDDGHEMVAVESAACVLQHAVRLVDHEELQVLQTDLKQKSFIF